MGCHVESVEVQAPMQDAQALLAQFIGNGSSGSAGIGGPGADRAKEDQEDSSSDSASSSDDSSSSSKHQPGVAARVVDFFAGANQAKDSKRAPKKLAQPAHVQGFSKTASSKQAGSAPSSGGGAGKRKTGLRAPIAGDLLRLRCQMSCAMVIATGSIQSHCHF